MADAPPRAILLFEGFRLDLGRACLLGPGGAELGLRPKSFDVLRHLVENAGRLVRRDELMQAVWPDVFVTDDSITQCVAEVRRALGDGAQRLLRTVPKRGYLLTAEVTRAEAPAASLATTTSRNAAATSPPPVPDREGPRSPAPGVAAQLSAERRQLTLLFCDLVGSTALSARLDPEDLQSVIQGYHRVVTAALEAQGGCIAQLLGDGVLAYFGWPRAREDDAERAVRAGLAATEAVSRLEAPQAGPIAARVGIATGLVVVGDVLGKGEARERGVLGETPNLAARLQDAAGPGSVVADATTRRLTGALFEWADLGEVALKGFPKPMRAWRALGPSGVESRFEALRGAAAHLPLVGREEELDLLLRRWRRACSGDGQVVLLRGEAGIGKSRLTAALQEALGGGVREELLLYCSSQHTDNPLHPVIARLERAAQFTAGDAPEVRLAKLEALLTPLTPPAEDVALISELLSVPNLGRWPALDLSPQTRRARLLSALLRRMRALAACRPLLVVVEDAHWLDPTTRELLDLVVAETARMALLLVVTHRPEFNIDGWPGEPHVTLVQLNRLRPAEHRAMLRLVAGGKVLPAEVEAEVLARTDGVPLFVEEVGRAVLESGLMREEADRWVLDGALPRLAVPVSLHASLMARLDRLKPAAREVAQAAAVVGRDASPALLAAVAATLDGPSLDAALQELTGSGMMLRRLNRAPDAVYAFKHALVQDAAYGALLRHRRRELHARAAGAVEALEPATLEREPQALAHHCTEGELFAKAVAYRLKAGVLAFKRSALAESIGQLEAGLRLLDRVADDGARVAHAFALQAALARVLTAARGYADPSAREAYARARQLCLGVADSRQVAEVVFGEFGFHLIRGHLRSALAIAEDLAERAAWSGDEAIAFCSHACRGITLAHMGELAAASESLQAANTMQKRVDIASLSDSISAIRPHVRGYLAWISVARGCLDQACEQEAELLGTAPLVSRTLDSACAACFSAWSSQLRRDANAVRPWIDPLVRLCEEQGFAFWQAASVAAKGWLAAEAGEVTDGIALLERGLAAYRAIGSETLRSIAANALAEALTRVGQCGRAISVLDEVLALVAENGDRWLQAETLRLKGEALVASGHDDLGEERFAAVIRVAREQGALLWELRASLRLAGLWLRRLRVNEARELLQPVHDRFCEGLQSGDLRAARAMLEAAEAKPP